MSTFGGPTDMGVGPTEELALVGPGNFEELKAYFLPAPPPDAPGLARRLDPSTHYLACRWEYATTPKHYLTKIMVEVRNPSNNKSALAKPIDWGPAAKTGRVADLSPGLASLLGLETDDICEVEIPHPGDVQWKSLLPELAGVASGRQLTVLTEAEIKAEFGQFDYSEDTSHTGAITITPAWAKNNLTNIIIPQLKGLQYYGGSNFSGAITCHKKIATPLKEVFAAIEQQGLRNLLLFWGGCHVPRHKSWNPHRGLSPHSWGIAIDINPEQNGYNSKPAPKGAKGSVVELAPLFESFGFAWGGHFHEQDGMHFEYALRP